MNFDVSFKISCIAIVFCGSGESKVVLPFRFYTFHPNTSHTTHAQVINGAPCGATAGESRRRGASSPPPAAPEKRKWPAQPYDADEPARAPSSDDDDTKVCLILLKV